MGVLLFVITSKFIIVHSHIMIIIRDGIVTHKKLKKIQNGYQNAL